MKVCSTCNKKKKVSEFRINRPQCKQCKNDVAKKSYRTNKLKILATQKTRRTRDGEHVSEIQRRSYFKNRHLGKQKGRLKRYIDEARPFYVKALLVRSGWPKSVLDASPAIIGAKKNILKIKRKIKENEKVQKTKKSK